MVSTPSGCGSPDEFRGALAERLGEYELGSLPTTKVTIVRDAAGYSLDLQHGAEHRTLRDAQCYDLFRAAVVMVVAASERRQQSAAAQHVPKPSLTAPVVRTANKQGFEADLGAGVTFGLLPRMAWGVKLEGAYRRESWGGSLSVRYLPAVRAEFPREVGLEVQAFGAHAGAWLEPWSELRMHLGCATYRLHGSGVGSALTSSGAVWSLGPVAGLTVIPVRSRHLWVGVGGEAHLELIRPNFEIVPYGRIFEVSPVVGSVFLRIAPVFR